MRFRSSSALAASRRQNRMGSPAPMRPPIPTHCRPPSIPMRSHTQNTPVVGADARRLLHNAASLGIAGPQAEGGTHLPDPPGLSGGKPPAAPLLRPESADPAPRPPPPQPPPRRYPKIFTPRAAD